VAERPATIRENGRAKAYRPLPEAARRAAFASALEAYERGDFFLAHEILEPAWMGASDPAERALHSGLIKVAAAFVHAVRGNAAGVTKNLEGAPIGSRGGMVVSHIFPVDADYSFTTNVAGTYNVLKAAASATVRRLVFSSSREVYGEPKSLPVPETAPLTAKNPYGASKVAGEAYCEVWGSTAGLECQILRFANVYGPHDRDRVIPIWIERARRAEPLELYGGEQIIDFVWVGKAVEALLAATHSGLTRPINVGSGIGSLPYAAQDRGQGRDQEKPVQVSP